LDIVRHQAAQQGGSAADRGEYREVELLKKSDEA
jgi:hypothetical protein